MNGGADTYVWPGELRRVVAGCLKAVRVPARDAATVADVLIAADLGGIDSHGCARLRRYVDGIRAGRILAHAAAEILDQSATTAVLDAGHGLGQPAAVAAVELAVAKARASGVAAVTVRRSNHFGIAGYYARLGARAGMLTIVTTNATPQVSPTNGTQRMLGTNPLAIGLPTDPAEPFVFDAATSVAPRGRLERLAQRDPAPAPAGWAAGPDGQPATDIGEILAGLRQPDQHSLLPLGGAGEQLGGHKGFGLGLIADLLCGPLAGACWGRHVYGPDGAGLGHFVLCLQVSRFLPLPQFRAEAAAMFGEIRASRPVAASAPVRIAGDGERRSRAVRSRAGIPLAPDVIATLRQLAEDLHVPPLQALRTRPEPVR